MNQNVLRLSAQFKTLFSRETGNKIDLVRFGNDGLYARTLLEVGTNSNNPELQILSLQLLRERGLTAPSATAPKNAPGEKKYAGSLR